jgi:hypothetical protein
VGRNSPNFASRQKEQISVRQKSTAERMMTNDLNRHRERRRLNCIRCAQCRLQRAEFCAPDTTRASFYPQFGTSGEQLFGAPGRVKTEEHQVGTWLKQNMLSRPGPNVAARAVCRGHFAWFFGRFLDFSGFAAWAANRPAEAVV